METMYQPLNSVTITPIHTFTIGLPILLTSCIGNWFCLLLYRLVQLLQECPVLTALLMLYSNTPS